jgi:hypothetical protein
LNFGLGPEPETLKFGSFSIPKLCFRVVFSETEEVIPTKMKLMQGPLVAKLVNQNQNHP